MPAPKLKTQNDTVDDLFTPQGRDWTLGEVVAHLKRQGAPWADKSTVNRVLDSLKTAGRIQFDADRGRKCTVTGRVVTRYFKGGKQGVFFS